MKHGRKTGWTKDRWLAYKAAAATYFAEAVAPCIRWRGIIDAMEDRED